MNPSATLRDVPPPRPDELDASPGAWLERLAGPTRIRIPGRDRARTRMIVTLVHGSEPSGFRALHRWLRSAPPAPATDLLFVLPSVAAASAAPPFSHRMLPGRRDLNRCFRGPWSDAEGALAHALLDAVDAAAPEALVDLHNTSAHGPAYAVVGRLDPATRELAAHLADHAVLTELRIGALTEIVGRTRPALTLECGGARSEHADGVALAAIETLAATTSLFEPAPQRPPLKVLREPVRVELAPGASVRYAPRPAPDATITLPPDVDRHNWEPVRPGDPLGWIPGGALDVLRARRPDGRDVIADLFELAADGRLGVRRPLELLMVTTDPAMARHDCLFYAVPPEELLA